MPNVFTTITLALFVYYLTIFWFRHIWPEIRVPLDADKEIESRLDDNRWTPLHPEIMTLKEVGSLLREKLNLILKKQMKFRHENPILFCLSTCIILSVLAVIGNNDNLAVLFDLLYYAFIFCGVYKYLLPKSSQSFIKRQLLNNAIVDSGDISDTEEKRDDDDDNEEAKNKSMTAQITSNYLEESKKSMEKVQSSPERLIEIPLDKSSDGDSSLEKIDKEQEMIDEEDEDHDFVMI